MTGAAHSPLPHPAGMRPFALPLELARLQGVALTNRPELLIARKKIEAAEARLSAARREWIPDPTVRVETSRYNDTTGPDSEVMAGVSINLHWLNPRKYSAAIYE